jgi:L-ascorbate metabolism protein UlaG (beta-lactamase superfamily)
MRPEEIGWSAHPLGEPGPDPVEITWLGTAGFAIKAGAHVLLIDPYVTRAPLLRCAFGRVEPDHARIAAVCPRADAIVLGHTHFDHALDAPAIALATGAKVFGSRSAANLCRAAGVPAERIEVVDIEAGQSARAAEVGPFTLRFLPSAHSRLALGRVPLPGDIADCDEVPSRITGFRCGAVFALEIQVAGKTIVHVGSAELTESVRAERVDLALACVAGWTKGEKVPERLMRALSPRAVLLSHWDDFFRSLDQPARILPAMKLDAFVDRLGREARDVKIGTVPLLGTIVI